MPQPLTDEDLANLAAIPRSVLDDVVAVVRRMRRVPGFWAHLRADLEESERRKTAGCARYEIHHDREGMVGHIKSLGVERDDKAEALVRKTA